MLEKQAIDISFAQGLDTKTDSKRVQMGKFLKLENTIFDKGGLLQKRNGYAQKADLPDTTYSYLTTFNGNLTAIGSNIAALNDADNAWVQRGKIQPLSVDTLPVIRNNFNQTACDITVAPNGIGCCVYLESNGSSTTNKYVVFDSVTGQNIVAPAVIPVSSGTVSGGMRVFVLGNNFILVFTNTITAVAHLQYVTVNINMPTTVGTNTDIAASYIAATTLAWDAYVAANDKLYISYNTTSGGQAVKTTYLTPQLVLATPKTYAGQIATMFSVTSDDTNPATPIIYVNYYDFAGKTGFVFVLDQNLHEITAPTATIDTFDYVNLASTAQNGSCQLLAEISQNYTFAAIASNFIKTLTIAQSGAQSGFADLIRSVGLASKAFLVDGVAYVLTAYQSPYQNTYFLINATDCRATAPVIAGKLAYENGGGYVTTGLPGIALEDNVARIGYRFKDLIQSVSKNTNVAAGTQTVGIYSQTGINFATFTIGTQGLDTAEIGNDLHLSGGFLWMYDGYLPVEHNFVVYPDSVTVTTATGSGSIAADIYYYQATYEWTDNQGNAFRSAPSIPVAITTTTASSTNTIKIPTLRLTMKTANPVKIVLYRWAVAQQNYYQVTSITTPTQNSTTTDSVTITDTFANATILGNNLIYTTGGVLEDVNAPASDVITLFDTRLWLVDAENKNLLWYSKQVIQATPVEMSDLLTIYVPPTTATQGTTGPILSLAPMDDKLIIGKQNALLYINGKGPDSTGANNQYSDPIFITATIGCDNQKSIVLIPKGLMFQSDKGIWLLDRGLGTEYIGAPVQDFTLGANVLSAVNIPATNQVRFTLDTGITLMYDYYYEQWSVFTNVPAISSCIFEEMHTFINQYGAAYQERSGTYLDGSRPVLMAFKTGPLRLGDLQGYQRAYFFYLLGTYISPHKLQMTLFYDYSDSPEQSILIEPTNYSTPYGTGLSQSPYGQGTPYGGPKNLELWQVYLERQRCMAVNIGLQEVFDPQFDTVAGAGLTLSGINMVCGFKRGYRPTSQKHSVG